MPTVWIFLLLLCRPAPALGTETSDSAASPLARKQAEASRLMDEMTPKIERLKFLQGSYLDRSAFPKIEAEHEQLTAEITALNARLDKIMGQLLTLRNSGEVIDVVNLINRVATHQNQEGDTSTAGLKVAEFSQRTAFESTVVRLTEKTFTLLNTDKAAFQAAEEAYEKQELWSRLTWALAALVTLAAAVGAWRKRERLCALISLRSLRGLSAGTVIKDNYRVDRKLGQGALGVVYEASDLTLQRKVALKHMREELFFDAAVIEKFLAEARLAAALKHPNIVETYAAFEEAGQAYLVFEFAPGRPLRALLSKRRFLSRPAKSIARQIAAALDFAHARGLLHRSLRPSNIMVSQEGVVKVADFGVGYQARARPTAFKRLGAAGALPYEAPELGSAGGAPSRASDLYSFAAVLYEMLTGRIPFSGPDLPAQKSRMRFPPPSSLVLELPPAVDGLIQKGLAADPKARFGSGAELAGALEAALP
ncbi:MAG: serine/threonine protein kinase [Elusimicrobia bacterium]|nr:serine/threonine protein kinase [Elusimicrobiota bacterium]